MGFLFVLIKQPYSTSQCVNVKRRAISSITPIQRHVYSMKREIKHTRKQEFHQFSYTIQLPTGQKIKPSSDQAGFIEFADNAWEKRKSSPLHPSIPAACCILSSAFKTRMRGGCNSSLLTAIPIPAQRKERKAWKCRGQQILPDRAQPGQVSSPGLSNIEMVWPLLHISLRIQISWSLKLGC